MANTFETWKKRAVRRLGEWSSWAETWVVPPVCVHCGKRRHAGLPVCRKCLREIRAALIWDEEVLPLPWVHSLFRMSPPLLSLIHGFKYSHYRRHIRFLCGYLRYRPQFIEALQEPEVLVPVPLHPARRRERGYNQSELIAGEARARFGLRVAPDALRRIRFTSTQTRLGAEERARNLAGAFQGSSEMVRGKKVLLVDDVCTTGSTLSHCREELLRAGAVSVRAFTLAWVERFVPEKGDGG